MSSTTQILFHSPALKSLKRDQLIKLCKRHGVKASGKNTELIERLKQRATELPPEAIEWRDSDEEDDDDPLMDESLMEEQPPRPSEQWEVVMDDIEEVEETGSKSSTLASLRSVRSPGPAGEFGTTGSKSSVTSNLKAAIANSFGLKRTGLAKKDTIDIGTTRSLPDLRSETVVIEEPLVEPIPGAPSRRGKAAPADARLSIGSSSGVTTTIRLISSAPKSATDTPPRLAPYQTTLELDMGTPGATRKNVWPPTPSATLNSGRLYPVIPPEDLKPAFASSPLKNATISVTAATPAKMTPFKGTPAKTPANDTPARGPAGETPLKDEMPSDATVDIFSPAKPTPVTKKPDVPPKPQSRLSVLQNEPFLFGSPLPRHSMTNTQFDNAAQEVLEEMNRRLAEAGVHKVEKTVLAGAGKALPPVPPPKTQGRPANDRFAKTHEKTFDKMDSIVNHYAARRPAPGAPATQPAALARKRKSEAVAPRGAPAVKRQNNVAQTRVFSSGSRKKMVVPGGLGVGEEDEDEEPEAAGDRRSTKRIRTAGDEDVHKGRRLSLLPEDGKTTEERAQEQKKRDREREIIKKKIEARRNSLGRSSVLGRAAIAAANNPKTSRLGIFGAAKSLVGRVWGMGAGPSKPAPTMAASAAKPPVPPPSTTANKGSVSQKSTASTLAKTVRSTPGQLKVPPKADDSTRSRRSRSPIPSFDPPAQTGLAAPRGATVPANLRKATHLKPPAGMGASSLGARTNMAAGSSNINSLGSKRPVGINPPASSLGIRAPPTSEAPDTKPSIPVRKRTISTLMAPTASSLARRAGSVQSPVAPSRATPLSPVGENTLQQITNSSNTPRPLPPRPTTKVFSSPIDAPSSPTSHLGANENMSLGAGASALMQGEADAGDDGGADGDEDGAAVPPKPKALVARKPRISRTQVIAKIGQQRPVDSPSRASIASSNGGGRTRSSAGATPRRSVGVAKNARGPSGAAADLVMKKRARQSEYARRKSKVGPSARGHANDVAMEVDA